MTFARRAAAFALLLAFAACTALAAPAKPARPTGSASTPSAPRAAAPRPATAPTRPTPTGDALDQVAALVNDEAVLASDVEEQLYAFLARTNAHPDSAQVDTLRHQMLDQLIDDKLLLREAKRAGITVSEPEVAHGVDQAIDEVKQRMGGEAQFQEQLQRENTTEAQLRERYHGDMQHKLLISKLVERTFPRKPVPMVEAEEYFKAHHDKFPKVPGEVRLSVIQIPPSPDSASLAVGFAKAIAARKRIAAGESFAKVAQAVSEDPGSAKSGGDLGFFVRGSMEHSVEEAAFSLPINTISQPVHTPYGWHLVQALERDTVKTIAHTDSLDDKGVPLMEAHARHILIRVAPNDADVARARATADRVQDEARRGTSFGALVHRYSKYDGPATPEGDVGFVSLGSLQPQIRAGLDSLQVGQVSEVLTNQSGFNLFKVTDRHPEREYTIEEIRNDLPDAVQQVQFREKYEAWLKTLRSKAQIEYRSL